MFPKKFDARCSSPAVRGAIYARPEVNFDCLNRHDCDQFNAKDKNGIAMRSLSEAQIQRLVRVTEL